jgi:oxysterol-binding protein 1
MTSFNAIDRDTSTLELYFQGNSLLRALNVAAFAVSGYASSEGRHCKPFNPLLGETYEANFPDKGVRFFSEKVSAL